MPKALQKHLYARIPARTMAALKKFCVREDQPIRAVVSRCLQLYLEDTGDLKQRRHKDA